MHVGDAGQASLTWNTILYLFWEPVRQPLDENCMTLGCSAVMFSLVGRSAHMTREEIIQAIEELTAQIRTLSYSSSKEAAVQRAALQQRRRELRAQLEETL